MMSPNDYAVVTSTSTSGDLKSDVACSVVAGDVGRAASIAGIAGRLWG